MNVRRSGAVALIAGGVLAVARPVAAQTAPVTVRIGAMAIDACGEAYYGNDTGIFQNNGINAQVSTLSNGATIISARRIYATSNDRKYSVPTLELAARQGMLARSVSFEEYSAF